MVDAAVTNHGIARAADAATDDAVVTVRVEPASAEMLARYRAFATGKLQGPAQHATWVEAFLEARGGDIVFLTAARSGVAAMMMPLEIVGHRGFRVARAIGGSHANGNFPAATTTFLHGVVPETMRALATGLRKARPDVDLLLIERQAPELNGLANPFGALPAIESPNVALAVDLGCGFEAILERVGRKRRLKKHRSQTRKLEAAGGYARIRASNDEEVERLMAAFLEQKADRFRRMGVENVFADMGGFLTALFKRALRDERPAFILHGLDVAGKVRAVTGSSIVDDRLICEFGSIIEDELVHASPGDFLFFENIEEAARSGYGIYDFSVGDEPYKRAWCDIEVRQFDTIAALSLKGRAYAAALRGLASAKRSIKSNQRLWAMVKRLRRGKAKAAPAPVEADDLARNSGCRAVA